MVAARRTRYAAKGGRNRTTVAATRGVGGVPPSAANRRARSAIAAGITHSSIVAAM
jgi:hypothetical protein